jgi:hypothetical protein
MKANGELSMPVYLVDPKMTIGQNPLAEAFFNGCLQELNEHIQVISIRNTMVLSQIQLTKDDVLVFFNKIAQEYSMELLSLLDDANNIQTEIMPIAVSKDFRIPPNIVNKAQSFDIEEQLRHRSLTEANVETIATSLARTIISRLQPTLSKENMLLFISHRRLDGEEIAAAFYENLVKRAVGAFRDLIDVKVGEDAQDVIEKNLHKSDAVIFIDTPKSGESDWIAKELEMALSINLPIVWVRVDDSKDRMELKVKPAGEPHFNLSVENLEETSKNSRLIDEIIHKAFSISRQFAQGVFDQLRRFKTIAKESGIVLEELDHRNFIYKISVPRQGFRYYQRPMTHLIQLFGRFPKDDDLVKHDPYICNVGYTPHPSLGKVYDASLLLGPFPSQIFKEQDESTCIIDSFDAYISNLQQYISHPKKGELHKKGIIISGAFPDCEPEYQQLLTDAIHAFVQAVFERGGTVIFGGHPTFQHLIFDMGKRMRPKDYIEAIHLYLSKWFVTDTAIVEFQKSSTVYATNPVDNEREKSLSLMRNEMIKDNQASALIAFGGKTKARGHSPGVDMEIELARARGLPVFLIGSVGGRTAEIASELHATDWKNKLNNLTPEQNKQLMISLDFRVMANRILDELGL